MFAVIFEAEPAPGCHDAYLAEAAVLGPILAGMDGFVENRRFRSEETTAGLLSLSFWRDEAALIAWRNTPRHRAAQAAGRQGIFRRYRLRVGRLLEETEAPSGATLVLDDPARPGIVPPAWPAGAGCTEQRLYRALGDPAIALRLAGFAPGSALPAPARQRHRIAVLRDYSMTERAEAPADALVLGTTP